MLQKQGTAIDVVLDFQNFSTTKFAPPQTPGLGQIRKVLADQEGLGLVNGAGAAKKVVVLQSEKSVAEVDQQINKGSGL
eukprot:gene28296-31406_t